MRNLKLITNLKARIEEAAGATCLDINFDNGLVYCAADRLLVEFDSSAGGKVSGTFNLSELADVKSDARFVAIKHLAEEQSLCAATNTGDLIVWNNVTYEVECVGSVESGITAMSWSPDQELLILTTGADTLIMMTREFDPITEITLHPDQSGEAEFVQVGWGKKETQFHGSAGKQAAHVKPEDVKPVQSWDDRIPRITWKADGEHFAISSIHPNTGARKMCVWTREGSHYSTSENVDGIEQALSWRPNGSLIATSQRRPNQHDIAFFEKNGLRHGEFTLPFSVNQVIVKEVVWSTSVLAVWCEEQTDEGDNKNCYVQLWTSGNYHWYLKQCLKFEGPEHSIGAIMWDPEQENKLHVICKNGGYFQYAFTWATDYSSRKAADGQALVSVIDGDKVLMTPMKQMVVPPPMSAYEVHLPSPVTQVVFAARSDDFLVVMSDSRVAMYKFTNTSNTPTDDVQLAAAGGNGFNQCCTLPVLQGIYNIHGLSDVDTYPLCLSHFTWLDEDCIVFSSVKSSGSNHSVIHKGQLQDSKIVVVGSCSVESRILATTYDCKHKCMAVQLVDGTVLKYTPDDEMLLPWETEGREDVQFPAPCTQMSVCEIDRELVVLGLTQRYRFYVNNLEVASNCTSFTIHDEFLLLTTLSHTCRCISLHTKVKDLPTLSDGKSHPFDESVRRVERGSQIVVAVPDDTKLVLQMPRGNLEAIHPRALVLTAVRKYLDRLQYLQAFTVMRKHRINMNLLYDHSPHMFLDNIKLFIQQIAAVNHINLFLTDLVEEDVTVTMYTAAYQKNKSSTGDGTVHTDGNKVNRICDAVRTALISLDENKYLLSVITTYVRKTKPELELALQLVKKLRDCQNEMPHISAEDALKYLLFLVDVNELYDVALGTYDFDLVLMVAEKSQKDPKEYIPFLNELRKMEVNYQRYTIDKYLKRYQKALENIIKCGADHFDECLTLINNQMLHKAALQLYQPSVDEYKEIACNFGDILAGKRQHEEAAIMYVKGEKWEPALSSYIACHQWQQVFCMTSQLKYSSEKEAEIARQVAEDLKTRGRHSEAAIVLEQYAKSDMGLFRGKALKGLKFSRKKKTIYSKKRKCPFSSVSHSKCTKKLKSVPEAHLSDSSDSYKESASYTAKRLDDSIPGTSSNFDMPSNVINDLYSPVRHSTCTKNYKTIMDRHTTDALSSSEEISSDYTSSSEDFMPDHSECNFRMPTEITNDIEASKELMLERDIAKRLTALIPDVVDELNDSGGLEVIESFLKLLKAKKFPTKNISFQLWCDVVRWFSCSDTRTMRYSEECLQFYWVGKRLFGGKFLRFMSGMKNESVTLMGSNAFMPETSRINFACPDDKILRRFCPLGDSLPDTFKPGIMEHLNRYKAEKSDENESYVLMLDGKKMRRGTDVDLLGCESGETLQQRQAEKINREDILERAISAITDLQNETRLVDETPDRLKAETLITLKGILILFSKVIQDLRHMKVRKEYALKKLKEQAGQEWRKSKYAFTIDLYMTTVWKIQNCMDKTLSTLRSICKTGAYLNGVGQMFADQDCIDLKQQQNVFLLKDVEQQTVDIDKNDTSVVKQRSDRWWKDRKKMKVTGSTMYQALGCDSLKRQKEHYDTVMRGKEPQDASDIQKRAMQHGTDCEVHQLATMGGIILPFMFPDLKFYEEGYYSRFG